MRDAVDPDRVPAAHLPRDERFRADAVRAERQRVGAQVNESGEVADLREGLSDTSTSVCEGGDEGRDVRGLFVLAYARLGIGADHIAPKRPRLFQPYGAGSPVNMLTRRRGCGSLAPARISDDDISLTNRDDSERENRV